MGRKAGLLFEVDEDRCFGCAACVALCPVNALTLEGLLAIVDEPSCTHCEHCIPACPVHAPVSYTHLTLPTNREV